MHCLQRKEETAELENIEDAFTDKIVRIELITLKSEL